MMYYINPSELITFLQTIQRVDKTPESEYIKTPKEMAAELEDIVREGLEKGYLRINDVDRGD